MLMVAKSWFVTSGEARGCSFVSLSVVLLSLSLSDPELLSEPLWLLESSRDCSAPSLLLLFAQGKMFRVIFTTALSWSYNVLTLTSKTVRILITYSKTIST